MLPGMAVRRIVPDLRVEDPAAGHAFYADVLGLEIVMDQGWIVTYAQPGAPGVQLSVLTHDAHGPVVPAASIEVDDVDAAHAAAAARGDEIVYPLSDEPWGVRRFFVREPGGAVLNILAHR
jgi:catechol 2,3-dioxygenase-like lactoylglutathione lyase family enzyme